MWMMKRLLSVFFALSVLVSVVSSTGITAFAITKTQSEAVSWANSKIGQSLDYDGVYGAQCVDLIKYYALIAAPSKRIHNI